MERADRNTNAPPGSLSGTFHRLRQSGIDEEPFDVIAGFEEHLHRTGTQIIKFSLHLVRDEQWKRFLARNGDQHDHSTTEIWKDRVAVKELKVPARLALFAMIATTSSPTPMRRRRCAPATRS